jgi:hypothetical protein
VSSFFWRQGKIDWSPGFDPILNFKQLASFTKFDQRLDFIVRISSCGHECILSKSAQIYPPPWGYAYKNPMTESHNTPLKDPAHKKAFHAPKNIFCFHIVIEIFFQNF